MAQFKFFYCFNAFQNSEQNVLKLENTAVF